MKGAAASREDERGREGEDWGAMRATVLSLLTHFEARDDWTPVRGGEGVEAWLLRGADLVYPLVRCRTRLGVSAAELMAFLVDDITETVWDWSRDIQACDEVLRISQSERVLLFRTGAPVPFIAPREDLFYVLRGETPDGGYFEASRAADLREPTPTRGAIRSLIHFAYKRIRPVGPYACEYDCVWQSDPRGPMSRYLPQAWVVAGIHDHQKDEFRKLRARYPTS